MGGARPVFTDRGLTGWACRIAPGTIGVLVDFGHLERADELTEADADDACTSREAFEALLAQLAQISAPSTGGASILIAFARLASTACEWVDGDLAIDLLDVDDHTEVHVMTDLGAGMRERLLTPVRLRMPLTELTDALAAKPSLAGALQVNRRSWKRLNLSVSQSVKRSTRPPRISDASLFAVRQPGVTKPPPSEPGIDAGWDDPGEDPGS